jgi:hypothetical protein
VTVMMIDIVGVFPFPNPSFFVYLVMLLIFYIGFTSLSSSITPQEIVWLLNTTFTLFDDIMADLNLEKVRTIGYHNI